MKRVHPTVYVFLPSLINLAILQFGFIHIEKKAKDVGTTINPILKRTFEKKTIVLKTEKSFSFVFFF